MHTLQTEQKSTLKKIQRRDVVDFYKKNLNINTATISIVSPLKNEDIIKLTEKISKSLNTNDIVKDNNYNFVKNKIKKKIHI